MTAGSGRRWRRRRTAAAGWILRRATGARPFSSGCMNGCRRRGCTGAAIMRCMSGCLGAAYGEEGRGGEPERRAAFGVAGQAEPADAAGERVHQERGDAGVLPGLGLLARALQSQSRLMLRITLDILVLRKYHKRALLRVIPQRAAHPVGISLAVGHLTLDQAAEVRILHPQPMFTVDRTGLVLLAPLLSASRVALSEQLSFARRGGPTASSVPSPPLEYAPAFV